jgi:hypothetical protein
MSCCIHSDYCCIIFHRYIDIVMDQVRVWSDHVAFVVEKSGTAAGFPGVFVFPLPITIPPNFPSS